MNQITSETKSAPKRTPRTKKTKRIIGIVAVVVVIGFLALGTKVVSSDDPLAQTAVAFDPATFGAENFDAVKEGVEERAVDAVDLSGDLVADQAAATEEYAVQSSGGPVFSTTFTGLVGEGTSGMYDVKVDGLPADQTLRVQFGPAINGTELRDATGEIEFGQFKNQIDFQNAAAALNEEVKTQVIADVDVANLTGKTVKITGAFTLLNPSAWLVTPVAVEVE